jgi:hypothetical protein
MIELVYYFFRFDIIGFSMMKALVNKKQKVGKNTFVEPLLTIFL